MIRKKKKLKSTFNKPIMIFSLSIEARKHLLFMY